MWKNEYHFAPIKERAVKVAETAHEVCSLCSYACIILRRRHSLWNEIRNMAQASIYMNATLAQEIIFRSNARHNW